MISWKILFIIFVVFVATDKIITVINLKQLQKNFPQAIERNNYNAEKNPIARWFFFQFGLIWGTIIYGFISLLTIFLAFIILKFTFHESIALYTIILVYGLVIFNNIYFLLKYSGVIP